MYEYSLLKSRLLVLLFIKDVICFVFFCNRMLIKDLICRKKKNDEQEEKDLEDPLPEKLKQCVVSRIYAKSD